MISLGALFREGWTRYREGLPTYIPLALITIAPALLFTLAGNAARGSAELPVTILGLLVNLIAGAVAGLSLIYAVSERGAGAWNGYVDKAWPLVGKYIGMELLRGVVVLVGFALFIIPGIILMVYLIFAEWALVFEGVGPVAALARSHEQVKGRWRHVAARISAIIIVAGFAVGIGAALKTFIPTDALQAGFDYALLLFLIPWIFSMMYVLYDEARRMQSIVPASSRASAAR